MAKKRKEARDKCFESGLFKTAIKDEDDFKNFFTVECSDEDIKRILAINMETGYIDRDPSALHAEDDDKYYEDKMDFFNKMPFELKEKTVLGMSKRLSSVVGTPGAEIEAFLLDKTEDED